jgi:diguanylate cyclase (GGDEF)-like protein
MTIGRKGRVSIMISNDAAPNSPHKYSIREWHLWRNSGGLIALLLFIEAVAMAGSLSTLPSVSLSGSEITRAVILMVCCLVYEESSRRVEALRFRFGTGHHADMTSVWMVAAAISLEPFVAVIAVLVFRTVVWFSSQRKFGMKLYRQVYTAATMICACLAIGYVLARFGLALETIPSDLLAAIAIIIAILVFTAVNRILVVAALVIATKSISPATLIGSFEDNAIEFATLSLGGITAVLLLGHPWLVVLVLAPMAALQRSTLVKQFQQAAMTDAKTGLLNAVAWQQLAVRELARAKREQVPAALLMIDLDHFKAVNDGYGHLAGDAILRSVADTLLAELRDYDAVGRFGGEEFVVLLPDADTARSILVSERLRHAIAEATTGHRELSETAGPLTVSIGVASFPAHGFELEDLMRAADAALYRAKNLGRDRVVLWSPDTDLGVENLV